MKTAFLIFPHTLFEDISLIEKNSEVYIIEESLFFRQYKFHKQKLVFHRASMKFYESYLKEKFYKTKYINSYDALSDVRKLIEKLSEKGFTKIKYFDECDDWLEERISKYCEKFKINTEQINSPAFINSISDLEEYFKKRKKYFQKDFYILQRKKLKILVDNFDNPIGGKWSYDSDNRKKYPKDKIPPEVIHPELNKFYKEAIKYVEKIFPDNYGIINETFIYPVTFRESEKWMNQFFKTRFSEFGIYEDAILENEIVLNHSVLSPLLNTGLITPLQLVNSAIDYGIKNKIPLNSLEGFIRQIIGWREFIRGVYIFTGRKHRTSNFFKNGKKIPATFYSGTTGFKPIDDTIKKILNTGFCHHIERLMILGNFMLLCNFNPHDVYKWFMEMFIDAYDWVMVPNVYGMSQFADGGVMATKPYISGSSYILKMSNYKKADWCKVWDSLFWNFMDKHRDYLSKNPRLSMLIKTFDKMPSEKKENLLKTAEKFLRKS
ncbi:MAG: cryptochrome/photolyase family protein [Ignavibacteria bacterium]|nr:cryptochrome/photolyase family protein [Ignavibacteria bacterium]